MDFARCIDCKFFGEHGAHCSLMGREEICSSEACVFFQWQTPNRLRQMDPIYFAPHYEAHSMEMKLRGMERRGGSGC